MAQSQRGWELVAHTGVQQREEYGEKMWLWDVCDGVRDGLRVAVSRDREGQGREAVILV